MEQLLDMAESKQSNQEIRDVKIGRPRVRGVDVLRDSLLNKVCIETFILYGFKNFIFEFVSGTAIQYHAVTNNILRPGHSEQ